MQSSQPVPPSTQFSELRLWHSILAGLIGGWVLIIVSPLGSNYNKFTFFQLLLDPIFLVAVLVQAMPAVIGAIVLWLFCWIIRPFRPAAALTAFIGCLAISFGLFYGNYIEKTQLEKPLESSIDKTLVISQNPTPPIAPTVSVVPKRGWNLSSLPDVIDGRWKLVLIYPAEAKIYLDTESITGNSYETAFWVKTFFTKPSSANIIATDKALYVTDVTHWFFQCSERTAARGDRDMYDIDGNHVRFDPGDQDKRFFSIVPSDTTSEALFNVICKR